MAIYGIGDLQGCYDELQLLLKQLKFQPDHDQLWFTGDLVNRGPKSLECLRFVKGLGNGAITVLGNHDLHLLANAELSNQARPRDTIQAILDAPDREDLLHWLRTRPLLHHDNALGYTMIHAGLPPQWNLQQAIDYADEVEQILQGSNVQEFFTHMYGNQPEQWNNELQGWDRLRVITNCFTRLRFCDAQGHMALDAKGPPGTQPEGFLPWFEHAHRNSKKLNILFGHWSTLGPRSDPGIFPLDTGCLWGGQLTALRLDKDPEWFHVQCPGACQPVAD